MVFTLENTIVGSSSSSRNNKRNECAMRYTRTSCASMVLLKRHIRIELVFNGCKLATTIRWITCKHGLGTQKLRKAWNQRATNQYDLGHVAHGLYCTRYVFLIHSHLFWLFENWVWIDQSTRQSKENNRDSYQVWAASRRLPLAHLSRGSY